MDKVKVGDKVKVTWEMSEIFGERGAVEKVGRPCKVKLDNGEYTRLYQWEIEKVEAEMDEFRVGDKVKVISNDLGGHWKPGYVGYITNGNGDVAYEVDSDKVNAGCWYPHYHLEKVEEEMEYEIGKPYLWFGGECPLPKGTKIKVRFGNEDFSDIEGHWADGYPWNAEELSWGHEVCDFNIVMFEVVEYPKSTRKVEMELTEEEITTIKGVLGKVNL